jgi:site-specific recombinase XerC
LISGPRRRRKCAIRSGSVVTGIASSEVEATTASCSSLVTVSSEQTARYSTSTAVAYRASEKACLGHVAPHDLRRTFVSAAVERGLDIESVRRLARHTAIRTTALYVGSESPVEELGADPVAGGFGG